MGKVSRLLYILPGLAIATGLILSILSWYGICTQACVEGHKYRLFGMKFELVGIVYFATTGVIYLLSKKFPSLIFPTWLLLIAGLGAEAMFILIQKFIICHWCPICLGVALSMILATVLYWVSQYKLHDIFYSFRKSAITLAVFFLSFLVAYEGIAKEDSIQEEANSLQLKLVLGNHDSPVQTYIFTSWICPACNKMEPSLERLYEQVSKVSRVRFIDIGDDLKSLNYIPYNLSFLYYNKPKYIELRHMLKQYANEKDDPNENEIEKKVAETGEKYQQLQYADVIAGMQYFKDTGNRFKLEALPTVIVMNSVTKQEKRFVGKEITSDNVMKAIESLKK